MPSLQDLLTHDPIAPETRILEIVPEPVIDDAAIRAIVSIISAHSGQFLKNAALRNRTRDKCTSLCGLKNSSNAVVANLELGIESVERLIQERRNGRLDSKIKSLKNAIRLLSVVKYSKKDDYTGGVANTHLSAFAHLYTSIVCKIERKDRASARHILQVFYDAPYLARRNLLPELWNHVFLPHLLHLKVWLQKEMLLISDWDIEFKEQRIKSLERAYNDQMDAGTCQIAKYYKDWIKIGADAPSLPIVHLPSVALCRNIYKPIVSLSKEQEDTIDLSLFANIKEKMEAKDQNFKPQICSHNAIEEASMSHRSSSFRLPEQVNDEVSITNIDQATYIISNSDNLQQCEKAIHVVFNYWSESDSTYLESTSNSKFCASMFIKGVLEISLTSKDNGVLECAMSILEELVANNEVNRQIVINEDPQLEILLRVSEKAQHFPKVVALVYLLKPKAKQLLSMDWIPLSLKVLDNGDESENLLMAAVYILCQVTSGFDDKSKNLENANRVVELGGVELVVKRLETGNNVKDRESCASILTACIRAESSCRDYLAANINKKSMVELFSGNQLKSNGSAIYLLCEIVCFKRISRMMEFINELKNNDGLNAMNVLLVYLQQAPKEQCPLVAVILLLLDLSADSSHGNLYREEGIDAIITALERSLHNKKLQDQCSKALLILGGRFNDFGDPVSETWLLKQAGLGSFHDDLVMDKANIITNCTNLEDEEKRSRKKWLRKVAIVLLKHGNKRLVVALSNCISDGTSELARSCLVTVAWMCSSLHDSKGNPQALACSILTPRLLESLNQDKALEERVLASLSLLNFARHRECMKMILPLSRESLLLLEDLSRVTWTAEELRFMCSLWSDKLHSSTL